MPIVLATEQAAIQAALATCWRRDPENARYCQIRSTLHLDQIRLSPSLYADITGAPGIEQLSEPAPLRFDDAGRLRDRAAA